MGRGTLRPTASGLDLVGGGVPGDGGIAEIGLVGHVAGQRGVVAEDGVFGDLLVVAHALEKSPEVRFFFVPGSAAIGESLPDGFLAGLGVVVLVPFLRIRFAHLSRIAGGVIAGGFVFAGLREIGDGVFGDFEDALGALEAINFRGIATEIEAEIDGRAAIVEERGVNVGHVATVREAEDGTERHSALGRRIPAEDEIHAAEGMDEEIASKGGAIFLPAAPTREDVGIERNFGDIALPGVPIEVFGREIGRRRIFPGAGGIVAAKGAFDESERADDAVGEELFGFGADDGAVALRTGLNDPAGFLLGCDHGDAVGGGMGHGLLAINVFAGTDGVDDYLFVPMIGNGGDEAVGFLCVEGIFLAAGGWQFFFVRFAGGGAGGGAGGV